MQSYLIKSKEEGQRLDKFLHKFMPEATTSFFYKMLRKKNITLNGKKAEGKEMLKEGDIIAFFFSDETFTKFRGNSSSDKRSVSEYQKAYESVKGVKIVYEDQDVLILNKPAGVLSQKATASDLSINEWMIGYLLSKKAITQEGLSMFKPSICNRLDRNTSGLVLCGKTLKGSQELAKMIRERSVRKYYRTIVFGLMNKPSKVNGFLLKDEKTNKVKIFETDSKDIPKEAETIETAYEPLKKLSMGTLLEVELITGKTHQIRAHLSSMGYPIVGDDKYGDRKKNQQIKANYGLKWQLLHAYRLEFPLIEEGLVALSEKVIVAEEPSMFLKFYD